MITYSKVALSAPDAFSEPPFPLNSQCSSSRLLCHIRIKAKLVQINNKGTIKVSKTKLH